MNTPGYHMLHQVIKDDGNHDAGVGGQHERGQYEACSVVIHSQSIHKDVGDQPGHQEPFVIKECFQVSCFQPEPGIEHEDCKENQENRDGGPRSGE